MALPVNRPTNEVTVSVHYPDVSMTGSCYAVAPIRGRVKRAYSVIATALTGADATWNIKVRGGSALRTATITQSGSAAGDVDSVDIGYMGTSNYVSEGDLITFTSNGESSTTSITRFSAVIEPAA